MKPSGPITKSARTYGRVLSRSFNVARKRASLSGISGATVKASRMPRSAINRLEGALRLFGATWTRFLAVSSPDFLASLVAAPQFGCTKQDNAEASATPATGMGQSSKIGASFRGIA